MLFDINTFFQIGLGKGCTGAFPFKFPHVE